MPVPRGIGDLITNGFACGSRGIFSGSQKDLEKVSEEVGAGLERDS